MNGRSTPAFGLQVIESLREDLRLHAAADERELATIRQDVKGLLVETSAQTTTLSEIQRSLLVRARTDQAVVSYERKRRLKLWGFLLTLGAGIVGALVHHFLP